MCLTKRSNCLHDYKQAVHVHIYRHRLSNSCVVYSLHVRDESHRLSTNRIDKDTTHQWLSESIGSCNEPPPLYTIDQRAHSVVTHEILSPLTTTARPCGAMTTPRDAPTRVRPTTLRQLYIGCDDSACADRRHAYTGRGESARNWVGH